MGNVTPDMVEGVICHLCKDIGAMQRSAFEGEHNNKQPVTWLGVRYSHWSQLYPGASTQS